MTIYKVIPQEKKQEKKISDKEVVAVPLTENEEAEVTAVHINIRRRSKMLLNLFLIIIALLVLATGITGGYYIYKNHLSKEIRRGICHFMIQRPINDMDVPHALPVQGDDATKVPTDRIKIDDGGLGGKPHKHHGKHHGHHKKQHHMFREVEMEEEIEVDGMVERIKMPKVDDIMDSLILHDFARNYSAIVDYNDRMCYVMKLNRKEIAPPKGLIDLIKKINSGYYLPKAEVLIRKFRVMTPALSDTSFLGPYISRDCRGFPTYKLERIVGTRFGSNRLIRRSAKATTFKSFGEYDGNHLIINEVNLDNFAL